MTLKLPTGTATCSSGVCEEQWPDDRCDRDASVGRVSAHPREGMGRGAAQKRAARLQVHVDLFVRLALLESKLAQAYGILVPAGERPVGGQS